MRVSNAAVALAVLDTEESDPRYLLRWSKDWSQWNLVGGHVLPHESPLACVSRKLVSETRVPFSRIRMLKRSILTLEYQSVSPRTGEPTIYIVSVFGATLRVKSIPIVTDGQMNEWMTEDQIASGRRVAGFLVSEMSMRAIDALREWRGTQPSAREAVTQ